MAVVIKPDAPLIAAPLREQFKPLLDGMVSPPAGVKLDPLLIGRARLANVGMSENAVAAIQPAVRPPNEAIQRLMAVVHPPAIEDDFRGTIGNVIAIAIRNKEQIRRRANPDASKAFFDA